MCSLVSRLNFTRESSFKGTPLDWALANVFKDRFSAALSGCEQNKTACSEIYQRHRHLNLPLGSTVPLTFPGTSQFWNKSNAISLWSSCTAPAGQQIMMTAKTFDRMRLCFKTKFSKQRFSDALLVAHRITKNANIFKFTFMLNSSTQLCIQPVKLDDVTRLWIMMYWRF